VKFGLESVALSLFGDDKNKITHEEINEIWKTGKGLKELAKYCIEDSETALKIAERYAPLMAEISKLVKQTLFETGRSSASMLVEYLLMNKAIVEKKIAPNKPGDEETRQRIMQTFKGGYVKEPIPGLHERLAVLDFSSLHPSIMISHNVSPETLDCKHKACQKNKAPNNHWFCTKEEGFLSGILKELFETRMGIKKQLRELKKEGKHDLLLDGRQHALKILMNSFYGYLGYARSRWFSRECASAVTAWSRHYVQEVLAKAEKQGFESLYGDTDSAFLLMPEEKKEKDVEEFVEEINKSLPGVMNLELEGFFKRGIFVTKESGEGAKKKYALIDYNNKLKIVGFEYVRRDWSGVAKETQRQVITAVLEEGHPEKAAQIVKETINRLRSGKAKKSELVILTQLKKPLEKYAAIGPHVAAAKKAVERGREMEVGSVIAYVITRSGKSISDRAQLEEYVKEGNYDSEYYIENQVMPAVIKIMRELGYNKQDLIQGGKQSKLGAFFGQD
jgi:DNA polymerase Pol2